MLRQYPLPESVRAFMSTVWDYSLPAISAASVRYWAFLARSNRSSADKLKEWLAWMRRVQPEWGSRWEESGKRKEEGRLGVEGVEE
ncbi:hypothetical protein RZS08_41630, partial [Arthrospira platensis SPKY1]|nr:hypothetical protein [Arthrospira platensis SPKY1]